jgi:hypothetical protein
MNRKRDTPTDRALRLIDLKIEALTWLRAELLADDDLREITRATRRPRSPRAVPPSPTAITSAS